MISVFILSSPRSGSTVTRLLLDKLPNMVALPETHFWVFKKQFGHKHIQNDISFLANQWVSFYTIKKYPVDHKSLEEQIIAKAKSWKDILNITVEFYLDYKFKGSPPKDVLICEKSPPHIFHTNSILKEYPSAKFIYLIRDPRDVVASLKTCSWSTSNPLINAQVWLNGIKQIRKSENVLVTRYEDFVSNPEMVMRNICDFLKVDFDREILTRATNDEVETKNPTSRNALKPISGEFINSYTSKLSAPDREQEIVERICRREMIKYGYSLHKYKKMHYRLFMRIVYYKIGKLVSKIA